jgi:D-Tyr-tRNAtyr deacylase
VKLKIQNEHQMQADLMKLIAYGKVMEDDAKTLKEYSIKEGDFIVVMVSKVCLTNNVDQSIRQSQHQRARPKKARATRFPKQLPRLRHNPNQQCNSSSQSNNSSPFQPQEELASS